VSRARLTALRLVGFKSFAERTTVEFGPGISAVVGPNGSGKSNLADALRWSLGEAGRTLRTRRSEDVIFAGSSARRAIGMADVTLVIDNHDRLLPVDFGEVEIGRRLYRSGENEYLLNRQKIRLRDLIELLDAGNLADNAFLFIGQGMVDQALALRPEERRPLFEEAAGVRRHERRRRQAEAELVEAEANLERLRDLLGELRPQAKRLAAQAEQLQARRSAGVELAEALLAAARARWAGLSRAAARDQKELESARAAADAALGELKTAEGDAAGLAGQIGRRAEAERRERAALDALRARLGELRVTQARLDSEISALRRDRERVSADMRSADERRATASAALAVAPAEASNAAAEELEYLERQLADAVAGATLTSDLAARRAAHDQQARRVEALEAPLGSATARVEALAQGRSDAEVEQERAARALVEAQSAVAVAQDSLGAAQRDAESAAAAQLAAQAVVSELEVEAAAARARLAGLDAALAAGQDEGLARAARARGASLVAEGLEIDQRFRAAVSAALGPTASAYLVPEQAVEALSARRGTIVLSGDARRRAGYNAAAIGAVMQAALDNGGGRLTDAIRRDPQGQVTRLLERVVWLPNVGAALRVRASLAPGWLAVTLAGELITDHGVVQLAPAEAVLDRRSERDAQAAALEELEERLAQQSSRRESEAARVGPARAALAEAQAAHEAARLALRRAEETERVSQRRAEQLRRESDWEASRLAKMRDELGGARQLLAHLAEDVRRIEGEVGGTDAGGTDAGGTDAATRRQRLDEMRARATELRRAIAEQAAANQAADDARRRAEVTLALDEARMRDLEAETLRITSRDAELGQRRAQLEHDLATAEQQVNDAAAALETAFAAAADERARLADAEERAIRSRDILRDAEARSRSAEVRAMEARLQLDQTREGLLVELASIGRDGQEALARAAGDVPAVGEGEAAEAADEGDAQQMEEVLARVVERWSSDPSEPEQVSANRLGTLRRRFHELGAGNPFAVEEYAEVRERLETLEAQRVDVENAITGTRELISSLSQLINDQFRSTFAALEDAFARRFHELFGGGDAQLSLTAPDDLSTTGVDIHARPPGKKRQPLSMLSGGERALTAVSLLLAMLEVRPVPFCVLDEVDAALDEANIGRFVGVLKEFKATTQFIMITHRKPSMCEADVLYGVTMEQAGVSKRLNVRFDDVADDGSFMPAKRAA
jgi:chromosome segregation protein